jgi:predicted nucleotidyltransferase
MKNVRLTDNELEKLKSAFKKIFLRCDKLWVFGSRANMQKKGGDIDLFVDTSLDIKDVMQAKLNFAKELFLIFDDRKIDIVVRYKNAKDQDIYDQAINTGVQIL